jgi:hypothetical protein
VSAVAHHTPGPWRLSHSGYANAPFVVLSGPREPNYKSKHPFIACDPVAEVFCDESPAQPTMKANARLIAAAPELLKLVQKLLDAEPTQFATPQQYLAWAELVARPIINKAVQS